MICQSCGGEVLWQGPLVALTHTKCQQCGQLNSQAPDDDRNPEPYGDEDPRRAEADE